MRFRSFSICNNFAGGNIIGLWLASSTSIYAVESTKFTKQSQSPLRQTTPSSTQLYFCSPQHQVFRQRAAGGSRKHELDRVEPEHQLPQKRHLVIKCEHGVTTMQGAETKKGKNRRGEDSWDATYSGYFFKRQARTGSTQLHGLAKRWHLPRCSGGRWNQDILPYLKSADRCFYLIVNCGR